MRDFSFSFLFKFLFGKALFGRSLVQLILAALSLYPFGVKEGGLSPPPRPVTGGPPLSGALSLYPFGIKESPNGTSLAMYPSVDFALQAQGYVSKGRNFLSDAPFGRFP